MPGFRPCFAFKSELAGNNIRNGQLIIVVDTGEIFVDYNGRRIALLQGGSGGGGGETAYFTNYAVVNADGKISPSLSGGGRAKTGVDVLPPIDLPDADIPEPFQIFQGVL